MLAQEHVLTVEQGHLTVTVKVVRAALAVVFISSHINEHEDHSDDQAGETADPAEFFERSEQLWLVALCLYDI